VKWISVKDRLPENKDEVLVYNDFNRICVSCYFTLTGKEYYWENRDDQSMGATITHWMPLPSPPKE
jgi:uncharacterized protein DUF551